jgi:hypothetical protein
MKQYKIHIGRSAGTRNLELTRNNKTSNPSFPVSRMAHSTVQRGHSEYKKGVCSVVDYICATPPHRIPDTTISKNPKTKNQNTFSIVSPQNSHCSMASPPTPAAPSSALSSTAESPSPLLLLLVDHLDVSLISEIMSHVGDYQYRFIASVNRRFQEAYLEVFPQNKKTRVNASTLDFVGTNWTGMIILLVCSAHSVIPQQNMETYLP